MANELLELEVDVPDTLEQAKLAREFCQRACDAGAVKGCSYLGWMHDKGGVHLRGDPAVVVSMRGRACELGEWSFGGAEQTARHAAAQWRHGVV